jgi:hypothetical protein
MVTPPSKIKIAEPKSIPDNHQKALTAPAFLHPIKKNRSLKLMEEIRHDK